MPLKPENLIAKTLIVMLNFLLPQLRLAGVMFAIIISGALPYFPVEMLLIEIILVGIVLLIHTYLMWDEQHRGNRVLPEQMFMLLLKRNTIVVLFYAPLVAIVTISLMAWMVWIRSVIPINDEPNRNFLQVIFPFLMVLPAFPWFVVVVFGWGRLARWVDSRILHHDVSENTTTNGL